MSNTKALSRRRRPDLLVDVDGDLDLEEVTDALTWATPRRLMRVADSHTDLPMYHPAIRNLLVAAIEDVLDYEERDYDREHSLERLASHLKHFRAVLSQDWVQDGLEREPWLVCRLLQQLIVQHPTYEDAGRVVCISDPFYSRSRSRRKPQGR